MTKRESIKHIMLRKFFNLIISLFATGTATADTIPVKILFIGNSYTHMNDMPQMFGKIAKDAGMNILVEKSALSGASFHVHSEREDMFEAINKRKWDYIILQGYSRELSFEPEYIDTATIPFLSKITQAIYDNNECTNVLFYMTWGYEDGFNEREEVNSYEKMADSIERGYAYLSEVYNVPVVPVGMVWKEVKNSTSIDLYAKDRAHPSSKGSYLIANTFFESIFGIPANQNLSIVREKDANTIRESVSSVLDEKRKDYKLDRYQIEIETEIIEDTIEATEYTVDYTASFPGAESIKWLFDDGYSSTKWSGNRRFKSSETRYVSVEITDQCGEARIYDYRIVFIAAENRCRRRREERKKNRKDKHKRKEN